MRALLSVYDKTGVVEFARKLVDAGYELVSSGGTYEVLADEGVPVTAVSAVTGAPEMLGGRVKTLHPAIHAGILSRGAGDEDELSRLGFEPIDVVVCNLYPFQATVDRGDVADHEIIEQIDIGGPAMVRAAAKNHARVTVVTDPRDYDEVAKAIEEDAVDAVLRRRLAADAFLHTAAYDAAIVAWLDEDRVLPLERVRSLRYGENPHQRAAIFREVGKTPWWLLARQLQGKEMSFNNMLDADAAWRLAAELGPGSAVVVKHTNPAGAARSETLVSAFDRAWDGDSQAAFGSVVALNGVVDKVTARALAQRFVEVVVATDVSEEAATLLASKRNLRVMAAPLPHAEDDDWRRVEDGFLHQERDGAGEEAWEVVSKRRPTEEELESMRFAWTVAAHTKSNAIVVAKGLQVVGVGAGDQSRIGASERALARAGERARGAVAASDAFFPFSDGLDVLADAGVRAVVQPGGSRNDDQVIEAADEADVAMVLTGTRRFLH